MYKITGNNLEFNAVFNEPLDNFFNSLDKSVSQSITHLHLGTIFNQDISNVTFPKNIIYLDLGWVFNRDISNVTFPKNIIYLYLGWKFNQDISNIIFPPTLIHLDLGWWFRQDISNVIFPSKLIYLHLSYSYGNVNIYNIALKKLNISISNPQSYDALKRCQINVHNLRKRQTTLFDSLL